MSVHYRVQPEHNLVVADAGGVLLASELIEAVQALYEDPEHVPGCSMLCDLRDVEHARLDYADVQRLLDEVSRPEWTSQRKGARLAIVAAEPHVYGMARMFEQLCEPDPMEVRCFNGVDEARAWLDASDASGAASH